jgi:hypothetical protein
VGRRDVHRKRGGAAGAYATLVFLQLACGDERAPDLPPVQWQSAHFRYAARADDPIACAGALATLEEHWAFWHERLGLPDPGAPAVQYLKFRDSHDLRNGDCPGWAAACTTGTSVRTTDLFDKHELIHAYLAETMAPPVPLFAEGAAVAFSCDAGDYGTGGTPLDWRQVLDPPDDSTDWLSLYPLSGQLVSYLYSRFGPAAFIRFYADIGSLAGETAIADAFLAAFGETLDDAWAAATSTSPLCLALWECSRPEVALDGAPHAATDVCGWNLVPRTLHMAAAGNIAATVRGAAANFGLMPACGDAAAPGALPLWPGGDFSLLAELPAGTYLVWGGGEVAAAPLAARAVGTACADLSPYPVPPEPAAFFVAAPTTWAYARLRFDQPRAVAINGTRPSIPKTSVWTCPDCGTDFATCPADTKGIPIRTTAQGETSRTMMVSQRGWSTVFVENQP